MKNDDEPDPPPRRSSKFQKGHIPRYTRAHGCKNKLGRELKRQILDAAAAVGRDGEGKDGFDGYLQMCAKRFPKQYFKEIARMVPRELRADVDVNFAPMTVNIVPLASDTYLSQEGIAKSDPTLLIEAPPANVSHEKHLPEPELEPEPEPEPEPDPVNVHRLKPIWSKG